MKTEKIILDACCGGRSFWFNKHNPLCVYADIRVMDEIIGNGKHARRRRCNPDIIMDFRKMDFDDSTFRLVIFDPPHLTSNSTGYMAKVYGTLNRETWRDDIRAGFRECFRVLEPGGILVFKWSESEIKLKDILLLCDIEPLFGHTTGKKNGTHWVCFMKDTSEIGK